MAKQITKRNINQPDKPWYKNAKYIIAIIVPIVCIIIPLIISHNKSPQLTIHNSGLSKPTINILSDSAKQINNQTDDHSNSQIIENKSISNFYQKKESNIPIVLLDGNGIAPGFVTGNNFLFGKYKIALENIIKNVGNASAFKVKERIYIIDLLNKIDYNFQPFVQSDDIQELKPSASITKIQPTDYSYHDTVFIYIRVDYTDFKNKKYDPVRGILFMPSFITNQELPNCPSNLYDRVKKILIFNKVWY